MSIEVNNESGAALDEAALMRVSRFVLDALGINPLAELSIVLTDADTMAALHQQWMDLPGPTDVMAFPMDPVDRGWAGAEGSNDRRDPSAPPPTEDTGGALLGDVVLCPAVAADQAAAAGHSIDAELQLLCTHGVLHLLGYDHDGTEDEQAMFELQARLIGEWTAANGGERIYVPMAGTGGETRDAAGGHRA
jgi:probable rRNA maturation factor